MASSVANIDFENTIFLPKFNEQQSVSLYGGMGKDRDAIKRRIIFRYTVI